MIRRRVAAVLALFALLGAACSSGGGSPKPSELNGNPGGGQYQGFGLDPAQPRPNFTLTDTAGAPFSFGQRTAGHPTFLFFGYTNCPDVCPTTMADVNQALASLPAADQKGVYVVFVSTDVKRDTASVLEQWLANFKTGVAATFVGLRGTQAQVDAAQTAAHIPVAEDGGQTHSAQVLLFGADDYARVSFAQSENEAAQMAHDLPLVLKRP